MRRGALKSGRGALKDNWVTLKGDEEAKVLNDGVEALKSNKKALKVDG